MASSYRVSYHRRLFYFEGREFISYLLPVLPGTSLFPRHTQHVQQSSSSLRTTRSSTQSRLMEISLALPSFRVRMCSHDIPTHTTRTTLTTHRFFSPNAKPVTFACCGIPIYCHPNNPRPTFRVNCHTPQPVQPAQNVLQHSRCSNQATSVGHKMR